MSDKEGLDLEQTLHRFSRCFWGVIGRNHVTEAARNQEMPKATKPAAKEAKAQPAFFDLAPSDTLLSKAHGAGALSLDVVGYADERSQELFAVSALLDNDGSTGRAYAVASAAYRSVRQHERMLRRRGGSNTVWRWRTHKPVHPSARPLLLGKSRRDRRRATQLRARTAGRGGLESEAWHAKRFEMARLFGGLRLPWRARDRSEKSAVRAANEGCVLHDASYWRCLSLRCISLEPILVMLSRMTGIAPAAFRRQMDAGKEVCCMLYKIDARPTNALAPVKLLACRPPAVSSESSAAHPSSGVPTGCSVWAQGLSRSSMPASASDSASVSACGAESADVMGSCAVWLFVHNAGLVDAKEALRAGAAALRSSSASASIDVRDGPRILRYELRGPTSHSVLSRALHHATAHSGNGGDRSKLGQGDEGRTCCSSSTAWCALSALSSPAVLPPRVTLGLEIAHPAHAPHPRPPPRRNTSGDRSEGAGQPTTPSREEARKLRSLILCWPATLAASHLYRHPCTHVDGGAAGGGAEARAKERATVSTVLVQHPPASMGRGGGGVSGGFGSGWDLLVPAGTSAGRAVWHALVMAGGRAIGQKELRAVARHADQPLFPYDYPDTVAGMRLQLAEAVERSATHARHPPARRTNHAALRVDHPFAADWPSLLGVPRTTLPAPGPGPGPVPVPAASAHSPPSTTEATSAASAAPESAPIVMQFGVLRSEHALAVGDAGTAGTPLPPLLKALAPRMLVRVSLRMTAKGRPYAPAAIHAMREEDLRAWRADHSWGGTAVPPRAPHQPLPAGQLLGFVTNGGPSVLLGVGSAVGFCAAGVLVDLLRSSDLQNHSDHSGQQGHQQAANQPTLLVLVRNPTSRQFRPAIATVRT